MINPTTLRTTTFALLLALVQNTALANTQQAACEKLTPPDDFLQNNAKNMSIIIPRGAGGGSHQLSSAMRDAMLPYLPAGTKIQLENIKAHHGLEAIRELYSRPKDGYTLLQHVDDVAHYLVKEGFTTINDSPIKPLAIVQITHSELYIRNFVEEEFQNWSQFQAYASQHPVTVAVVGHKGSMEGLYIDKLNETYNLKLQKQAFNNPSERYMAMIKDEARVLIEQPGDVSVFRERKLFKPILCLPKPQGDRTCADAPPNSDPAMPSLERFRGFFVHRDVDSAHTDYLQQVINCAYHSDPFIRFNRSKEMHDRYKDSEGAAKLIDESIQHYLASENDGNSSHH